MKTTNHLLLIASVLSVVGSSPVPQQGSVGAAAEDVEYAYDDYQSDADTPAGQPPRLPDPADLAALFGSAAKGFMELIQRKVDFLNNVIQSKDFQERVGQTVKLGLDVTGAAVEVGAPIAMNAIQAAPRVIADGGQMIRNVLENEDVRNAGSAAVRTGALVANTVARESPQILADGARLAGSISKAAGQTIPLVVEGLQQFSEQVPFFVSFGNAYVTQNAEQIHKATSTFSRTFSCDYNCNNLQGSERETCQREHCEKSNNKENV